MPKTKKVEPKDDVHCLDFKLPDVLKLVVIRVQTGRELRGPPSRRELWEFHVPCASNRLQPDCASMIPASEQPSIWGFGDRNIWAETTFW